MAKRTTEDSSAVSLIDLQQSIALWTGDIHGRAIYLRFRNDFEMCSIIERSGSAVEQILFARQRNLAGAEPPACLHQPAARFNKKEVALWKVEVIVKRSCSMESRGYSLLEEADSNEEKPIQTKKRRRALESPDALQARRMAKVLLWNGCSQPLPS